MDVRTQFLNGDLEKEIYMLQLEGCIVLGQNNKVCKLEEFLYGLIKLLNSGMRNLIKLF
jgi:hypothetical protein